MRSYLEKGPSPQFVRVALPGASAADRIGRGRQADLKAFVERAPVALPSFSRPNVLEMVELARDEEQSFYRILALEADGGFAACVGFGAVAGCEGTYDFFGCVGADAAWALRAVQVWAEWLQAAGARLARVELDGEAELALRPLAMLGFAREGTLSDFYGPGNDQSLVIWRPCR
jgi:hypothetical protein